MNFTSFCSLNAARSVQGEEVAVAELRNCEVSQANTFFSVTLCKSSPKWCHTFSKDALREVAMGQLSAAKSSAGLGFGVCLPLLGSHFPSWLACHKSHVSSHLFIDCKWFPLHSNSLCMCVCVWRQTVAYCCYWEQAVIHHIYIQGIYSKLESPSRMFYKLSEIPFDQLISYTLFLLQPLLHHSVPKKHEKCVNDNEVQSKSCTINTTFRKPTE